MTGIHDMKTRSCLKAKPQVSEIEKWWGARSHKVTFTLDILALKGLVFILDFKTMGI